MKPWKIRVDWLLNETYGEPVEVILLVMGEEPVSLRSFPTVAGAVDSAIGYMADRGCEYWCQLDWHEKQKHTHITLHAHPKRVTFQTVPLHNADDGYSEPVDLPE